ncbi:TPA: hypothetical protein QDB24_005294 [Burkholderia vietnamiensis]|uniref:hypothetical protein n=1 Tax=Burkholderia vietnamiensis TaxID=60552 RepID=UPI00075A3AFE|nr:hypothetical protein [Burkholderia vietnamiensis]KVF35743.1 hypothetical protein WJ09_09605 [Burkholderia vietnamiensis]MBR7910002.1 hypothetical protein [Burkholderia vietnamiensis]HDR9277157.1 hypothetical protein [Burkholderia vietnamiensis]
MKERPILFSGPMVRAILEGRKTQTRRVVKPAGAHHLFQFRGKDEARGADEPTGEWAWCSAEHVVSDHIHCPYGKPGDRLWVRETHLAWWKLDEANPAGPRVFSHVAAYAADGYELESGEKWIPSIHMLRAASRITLEITGVRVERLQAISWNDAIAEGIKDPRRAAVRIDPIDGTVAQFRQLWDGLNAARGQGWDANPWVWVIEFRRIEP